MNAMLECAAGLIGLAANTLHIELRAKQIEFLAAQNARDAERLGMAPLSDLQRPTIEAWSLPCRSLSQVTFEGDKAALRQSCALIEQAADELSLGNHSLSEHIMFDELAAFQARQAADRARNNLINQTRRFFGNLF